MIVGIGTQLGRTLSGQKDFTLDSLVATAFDPYLTSFDGLLPPLFEAYRATPVSDPLKVRLTDQIEALEHWDRRWSVDSAPTALAIYFAQELWRTMQADPGSDSLSVLRRAPGVSRGVRARLLSDLGELHGIRAAGCRNAVRRGRPGSRRGLAGMPPTTSYEASLNPLTLSANDLLSLS